MIKFAVSVYYVLQQNNSPEILVKTCIYTTVLSNLPNVTTTNLNGAHVVYIVALLCGCLFVKKSIHAFFYNDYEFKNIWILNRPWNA